ncbi:MAG: PIG-L family deacetylase [Gemmataceae bacterium]|nr:PIG-L family deacetylase [Gemmataceae bacterium]
MSDTVLSILSHPDDAEFLCAGTMARLAKERDCKIHIATMTAGDCGSATQSPGEIAAIRKNEGAQAAAIINAKYHCLEEKDLLIFYAQEPLFKITRLIREVNPKFLFTHYPSDYMPDHEQTSLLVRAAAFCAPVPNFCPGGPPPTKTIPHLYYCDPIEGTNPFGSAIEPQFLIDITSELETKANMLAAHASQRDWLLKQHGLDHYVQAMKKFAYNRGTLAGVQAAEGFSQHLGHSYPQDNILANLLGAIS